MAALEMRKKRRMSTSPTRAGQMNEDTQDETIDIIADAIPMPGTDGVLSVANLNEHLVKLRVNPCSMTNTYGAKVHDEPLQIRIANMRHLLGWEKTKTMAFVGTQLDTMASLVSSYCTDLNAGEANRAATEILRLSTAFYRFYRVDRTARRTHRANLCARISYNLLELANRYFEQDFYAAAGQLFVAACRLHSPPLLTKKSVGLLLKLLMGPSLVRAIKAFTLGGVNS